ncbi:hypothetical protein FN976_02520 [Caenimonas sedimenti]|uniref:Uncharacterized protein n=1 Tax=Caenimonas sedimenti TaxID=2596921 RepID=A0A562ZWY3_9BURK|nr:hypothetical protein [Caenimonas sedimenti]TWO73130.1 hypothetical protein FN976_02520 [Caenimonas sedimenti]
MAVRDNPDGQYLGEAVGWGIKRICRWAGWLVAASVLAACGGAEQATLPVATAQKIALEEFPSQEYPLQGSWWNPQEPGTGFFFERQGKTGVVTLFVFDAVTGRPVWYAGTGTVSPGGNGGYLFSAVLSEYTWTSNGARSNPASSVEITFWRDAARVVLPTRSFDARKFAGGHGTPVRTERVPETGIFWNAGMSGMGYTLEMAGPVGTLGVYRYAADGSASWSIAAGEVRDGVLRARLLTYRDGQALRGPYKAPAVDRDEGEVTITFTDPCTAKLTFSDGRSVALDRFTFETDGRFAWGCRSLRVPANPGQPALPVLATVPEVTMTLPTTRSIVRRMREGDSWGEQQLGFRLEGPAAAFGPGAPTVRMFDPGLFFDGVVPDPVPVFPQERGAGTTPGTAAYSVHPTVYRSKPIYGGGPRQGTLQVVVCLDAACTRQPAGSPFALPYLVDMVGTLDMDRGSVHFTTQDGTAPPPKTFTVQLPPGTTSFFAGNPSAVREGGTMGAATWTASAQFSAARPTPSGVTATVTVALTADKTLGLTEGTLVLIAKVQGVPQEETWSRVVPVYHNRLTASGKSFELPGEVRLQAIVDPNKFRENRSILPYRVMPGTTTTLEASEYLSHPQEAEGHEMVRKWLTPAVYADLWISVDPCPGSRSGCLPPGIYRANAKYSFSKPGAPTQTGAIPVVMEVQWAR